MRPNKIKQLWREGKPAAIAWVGSADPYMAEVLANVASTPWSSTCSTAWASGPTELPSGSRQ